VKHFELNDLLCEALIALEAGDAVRATRAVEKAIAWVEADWLASPSDAPPAAATAPVDPGDEDDD
jgi:hypothetical protein